MASKIAKAEARTRPDHVRTSRPHIEVRPLRIKIVLCLENEMVFSVFVYDVRISDGAIIDVDTDVEDVNLL